MTKKIISIDQGTTSTRAVLFDDKFRLIDFVQKEFSQSFPFEGAVEHDPSEIWSSVFGVTKELTKKYDAVTVSYTHLTLPTNREV